MIKTMMQFWMREAWNSGLALSKDTRLFAIVINKSINKHITSMKTYNINARYTTKLTIITTQHNNIHIQNHNNSNNNNNTHEQQTTIRTIHNIYDKLTIMVFIVYMPLSVDDYYC